MLNDYLNHAKSIFENKRKNYIELNFSSRFFLSAYLLKNKTLYFLSVSTVQSLDRYIQ